ncbi:MAG: hypothetical protein OQL28_07835 [Sedimenticola sp.]|nr:hypothetical protein [Sedimenticola sp.]
MVRQQCLVALLLLLASSVAQAHLLRLFAYVEGGRIHGSVYFAGGGNAAGARVRINSDTGTAVANLITDPQGEFSYAVEAPGEYLLTADSGDGHQARWRIRRDEFTGATALPDPNASLPAIREPAVPSRDAELSILVEQAVARQIGPLRQQLQRQADRARLSDIIGGIGFIFGIAGLLMWWRASNRDKR